MSFGNPQNDFDPSVDYYSILGLSPSADDKQIKSKYYKLAQEYHPDKKGGNETKFKEISTAYGVLSDQNKKQEYDSARAYGYGQQSQQPKRNPYGGNYGPSWGQGQQQSDKYWKDAGQQERTYQDFGSQGGFTSQSTSFDSRSGQYKTTYRDNKGNQYEFYSTHRPGESHFEDFFGKSNRADYSHWGAGTEQQQRESPFREQQRQYGQQKEGKYYTFDDYMRDAQRMAEEQEAKRQRRQRGQSRDYQNQQWDPRDDPFNTPFENWYNDERRNPFSKVAIVERFLRIVMYSFLAVFLWKVFISGPSRRRQEQMELEHQYHIQAQKSMQQQQDQRNLAIMQAYQQAKADERHEFSKLSREVQQPVYVNLPKRQANYPVNYPSPPPGSQ